MPYQIDDLSEDPTKNEEEEVSNFVSALAGIYTGLWNIPKGMVSLGAELVDLGLDTNTAAATEKFFDDLNPFDDEAEARTIGRVTQALAQIAPVGVYGFVKGAKYGTQVANKLFSRQKQIARDLAKKAIDAKKAGKAFKLAGFGRKISKTGFGVVGGGIGEALVADEEIGTLADMLKGTSLEGAAFTMMDRDTKEGRSEAYRRLMNRVKFGTEGALFNLGFIGAGKGIKKLRTPSKDPLMAYSDNTFMRTLQKYVIYGAKPEGVGNKPIFEFGRQATDEMAAVNWKAIEEGKDLMKELKKVFPAVEKTYLQKTGGKAMTAAEKETTFRKILNNITDVLRVRGTDAPGDIFMRKNTKEAAQKLLGKKNLLAKQANRKNIRELQSKLSSLLTQRKTLFNQANSFKQVSPDSVAMRPELVANRKKIVDTLQKLKDGRTAINAIKNFQRGHGGIFKITNYDLEKSPQWKSLQEMAEGADFKPIEKIVKSMRAGIDNMSYRFLDNDMPEELARAFNDQIGSYGTIDYKMYVQGGLLNAYKPIAQDKAKAVAKRYDQLLKKPENVNRTVESLQNKARRDVDDFLKHKGLEDPSSQRLMEKDAGKNYKSNLTKQESEGLKIDTAALKPRKLEEWQKIAAGEITDPTWVFHSSATKLANLNSNTKFLNNVYDYMSRGKGAQKLMFTEEEMLGTPFLKEQMNNPNRFKKVIPKAGVDGLSPLEGLYIRAPVYDEIFKVSDNLLRDDHIISQLYRYGIIAPKGISQVSKTILSALTHARNFVSAGAFAAANGILIPGDGNYTTLFSKSGLLKESDKSLIGIAKDITWNRVAGSIPEGSRPLYERALKAGIVGTQVEANVMKRNLGALISDNNEAARDVFGRILDQNNFRKAITKSREIYGKLEDAYIAEDDFWKFLTWGVERNRHSGILQKYGVDNNNFNKILKGDRQALAGLVDANGKNVGNNIQKFLRNSVSRNYDPTAKQFLGTFDDFVDEMAGNIVRNNVPNYAYIGRGGQALRMSPFGNFIAFPLEVIRTGNNIYEQAIKEIKSDIPELASIGWKRLFSFASTTAAIPYGATAWFKNKHGVDDEEMQALRRYVPPWSKNSTLLPMGRDENGYLKYVDFSYGNAYDVLIRPFNAIMNEFANGAATEQSLMAALGKGTADAFMEISDPFVSESIFTEALFDSTIRRGYGLGGRRVWSEADDTPTKLWKGTKHIAEAFKPGSIDQFRRIKDSALGKSDEYGRVFNFEDEMRGLAGFRVLQSNPERGLIYKTTKFARDLKNAENLFTASLLRGGRVTPEQILNAYKYSEHRRFETLKEMYRDIEAAKVMGLSNLMIKNKVKRRGISNVLYEQLVKGNYSPKEPSEFFKQRMAQINRDLNVDEDLNIINPYLEAKPYINEIIRQNRRLYLLEDELFIPGFEEQEEVVPQGLSRGGRVSMENGGEAETDAGDKQLAESVWATEPENVKEHFEYDFERYYISGVWMNRLRKTSPVQETAKAPTTPLPETPPIDPKLVSQMTNTNVMQTGLTPTEMALLSNEEKVIRLRQRGIAQ